MIPWIDASATRSPSFTSALHGLGEELAAHGFTSDSAASLLGAAGDTDLLRNSALYSLWSRDRANELSADPAGVLTELFVRNGEIALDLYERRISRTLRSAFDALQIMQETGGKISARVSISPLGSAYYLSDQLFECRAEFDGYPVMAKKAEGAFDPVMPPHASTLLLLQNTAPRGKRLLDVGTGSGVLALHRSDRYASVAGIDIDPRAVAYARLNALLAGREAAFEVGDFRAGLEEFGPVDHVLFNAPGRAPGRPDPSGDAPVLDASGLVKDVVGCLPKALAAPGGLAEILVIVPVPHRLPGAEDVVAEWLGGPAPLAGVKVTEVADPALSVPADAIDRLRIQPGCLLADDRAEAESLVRSLKRGGIRNVAPAIVSISS
ncbi:50S ribosomal protein L11 methyltransferase [Streptomyces sp. NPDC003077]|uniref:50S ribosomal protein L11 methyltransferase n=1 Tax=Streptomyces sp. NPDC003077 TaxID=3154443 RepID=UPI0033BE8400